MKSFFKIAAVAASALLLGACSTSRQIPYFQDLRPGEVVPSSPGLSEIRIRPKDKLSILVNSQDPRLTNLFNLPIVSQQVGQESSYNYARGLSGYTVDSDGCIDFPVVGRISVGGMTREGMAACIKEELQSRDLVRDPVVTVEFMNLTVSVLGEVSKPGRYSIDRDRLTVLDALGLAGDLTVYGQRGNVLVLRDEDGGRHAYRVDLRSARQLCSSPAYYLRQGDVVYVEPNKTRARQSTVNGNNVRSTSFWISLSSLLTSIGILVFN